MALLLQAWPGPSATDEFGCCTPPDSTGAVGPTNYVETVNRLIAVYDRSGIQLSRADLGDFVGFGSLNTFDPQMQWDQVAGRWLYAADVVAGPGGNFLAFGWSKTADPSDLLNGWCLFGLNTGTHFNDFPKLGHDDTYATIGTNVFNDTVGAFETSNLWVYQKPALGDPNCPMSITIYSAADATNPLRNADGTLAFTPVPANTSDSSALGFVTAAHTPLLGGGGPQTKIMLWHISGSPGVPPTLTADGDLTVSVFDIPADVPQPGSAAQLASNDTRLTQSVAHADPDVGGALAVWTQHTIAPLGGGVSRARWYEIVPSTMTVRQEGEVQDPTDWVFNAAISNSISGNDAGITYNRGSQSQLALIAVKSRMSTTPLGQMDAGEVVVATSVAPMEETAFTGNCAPRCRWGDYAGASPDPITAGVVFFTNMASGPPNGGFGQWITINGALNTAS